MHKNLIKDRIQNRLIEFRNRFLGRVFLPIFMVSSFLAVFTFTGNILMQQLLPAAEIGKFTLILTLIIIIGPISHLGQGGQLLRKYSSSDPGTYNWPKDLLFNFLIIMVITTFSVGVTNLIYGQTIRPFLTILWLCSVSLGLIGSVVAILRSHQIYLASAILSRAPFAAILILVIMATQIPHDEFLVIIAGLTAVFIVIAISAMFLAINRVPVGRKTLVIKERFEGLHFMLWGFSDMISTYGEIAIGAIFLNPASLAIYAVAKNLSRLFELVRNTFDIILPTEISKKKKVNTKRNLTLVGLLTVFLVVLHGIFGPILIDVFFGDKYDAAKPLVILLALAGGLRLIHAFPHSSLIVDQQSKSLIFYLRSSFIFELVGVLLILLAVSQWGLNGMAIVVPLLWLGRLILGFVIRSIS